MNTSIYVTLQILTLKGRVVVGQQHVFQKTCSHNFLAHASLLNPPLLFRSLPNHSVVSQQSSMEDIPKNDNLRQAPVVAQKKWVIEPFSLQPYLSRVFTTHTGLEFYNTHGARYTIRTLGLIRLLSFCELPTLPTLALHNYTSPFYSLPVLYIIYNDHYTWRHGEIDR